MDESNIPIDINIGKLQEWLVSRRHVDKEWQKSIKVIREKINIAIQDMPKHDGIAELLAGSHINYFHCIKIIEILKLTEADSKNIFGSYGSQRMKDWLEIVKLYEKDNLYLAEVAQMLVRNIQYEVPSLKKQITKQEQLQTDYEKRALEYLKSEAATKAEFQSSCKQLGISGENIKKELVQKLDELPEMFQKVADSVKPMTPAIDLYKTFLKYHIPTTKEEEVLPLLKYIAKNGNTTVYEWTYGEPPLKVEVDTIKIEVEDDNIGSGGDAEIDFGDVGQSNEIDFRSVDVSTIDFGDSTAVGEEIDWGNIESVDVVQTVDESKLAEISLEDAGIVVESAGVSGGTARGNEALTVIDNVRTNALLVRQLDELESFLKMRLYETSQSNEGGVFGLIQDLPSETVGSLGAMLEAVRTAIGMINDTKLKHLHNIKHSPRYVDVLTDQLKHKLSFCEKLKKMVEISRTKAAECRVQEDELRPQLKRLVKNCTDMQGQIERDISRKYKGRPVNIIGGVKFL